MPADDTPTGMDEGAWESLLDTLRTGECTPFLGAGACQPHLPAAHEISARWLQEFTDYPFKAGDHLAVSQYLATTRDALFPKRQILRELKDCLSTKKYPDFAQPTSIHGVLARLPFSVYLTTNYDDVMEKALEWANKEGIRSFGPWSEYCRWHRGLKPQPEETGRRSDQPSVYHFHGRLDLPKSIVLTEDDYEDFLVELAANKDLIPDYVKQAISDNPLLFVGYSMQDWNFRVLFRAAVKNIERSTLVSGVTVQLSPDEVLDRVAANEYLQEKYKKINLRVYWGDAKKFAAELFERALAEKIPAGALE
jgi:hypothetical protein